MVRDRCDRTAESGWQLKTGGPLYCSDSMSITRAERRRMQSEGARRSGQSLAGFLQHRGTQVHTHTRKHKHGRAASHETAERLREMGTKASNLKSWAWMPPADPLLPLRRPRLWDREKGRRNLKKKGGSGRGNSSTAAFLLFLMTMRARAETQIEQLPNTQREQASRRAGDKENFGNLFA